MHFLTPILIVQCLVHYVMPYNQPDASYIAAVLEYAPHRHGNTPEEKIYANAREYAKYIEDAALQGAQIIVFPEHGLTGWEIDRNALDHLSTTIPDPSRKISPCSNTNQYSNYSRFFSDLSCVTRKNGIYTVLNVIERDEDDYERRKIYYNTNVVFDRNGEVIARYRKINLYDEAVYMPGLHTTSTFRTDFDVIFGMFISSDILFKNPALDILGDTGVTDILYSSAWFSELPFYGALSVQHGYAKANGVNLLASGLSDPESGTGGSGVYWYDGRIKDSSILSGSRKSKLMINSVPKIRLRKEIDNSCQGSGPSNERNRQSNSFQSNSFGQYTDMGVFHTTESNMAMYTQIPLNTNVRHTYESICSEDSNFCCTFNITMSSNVINAPNYVYKLVAFFGISKISSIATTLGQRNCALVACLNENINSCGGRNVHSPNGVVFEKVEVRGTFEYFDERETHQQPTTLKHDLTPINDYVYCIRTSHDSVDISVATTKYQDSLLTFGIIDRIFEVDGQLEGMLNNAALFKLNIFVTMIVMAWYIIFR